MPILLRHLIPLIVIGAMFLVSMLFVLMSITVLGRLFRRPDPKPQPSGPILEGTATIVPDRTAGTTSPPTNP